ncbi:hypothetical protein PR048_023658, partial [Dryococelus australis]
MSRPKKKPPNYVMNLASLPPTSASARQHSLLKLDRRTGTIKNSHINFTPSARQLDASRTLWLQRRLLPKFECAGEFCFKWNIPDSEDEDDIEGNCDIEDHVEAKCTNASTREKL